MTWAVCWTWENLGLKGKVGVLFYDANTASEAISICIKDLRDLYLSISQVFVLDGRLYLNTVDGWICHIHLFEAYEVLEDIDWQDEVELLSLKDKYRKRYIKERN